MNITLGTVNFGIKYGVKSKSKVSKLEAHKILNSLPVFKIKYIDTARGYGDSEKIIGKSKNKSINIITKLPKFDLRKNIKKQIINNAKTSLSNLNRKEIYGFLLHNSDQLLSPKGKEIYNELKFLKLKGVVKKIGFSLYYPQTLKKLIQINMKPDFIQIPYSILDKRFDENNFFKKLKKQNIEIHVRSIFLQGLLLMNHNKLNRYFKNYVNILDAVKKLSNKYKLTNLELAFIYVMQNKNIDNIIIGVDNFNNLKEIIEIHNKFKVNKYKKIIFNDYKFNKKLALPINWKL